MSATKEQTDEVFGVMLPPFLRVVEVGVPRNERMRVLGVPEVADPYRGTFNPALLEEGFPLPPIGRPMCIV